MKKHPILALTALTLATTSFADTLILNPAADATVNFRAGNAATTTNFGTAADLDLYYAATPIWAMAYVRFDLSSLAGATITNASLTFTKVTNIVNPGFTNASRGDALTTGRFAVYGLLDVAGNTPQNWSETTITAGVVRGSTTATLGTTEIISDTAALQVDTTTRTVSFDGLGETVNGAATTATVANTTGNAFINFLQSRIDASSSIGLTTFIVDTPDTTNGRGFAFGSREDATNAPVLTITYTPAPVPEPATWASIVGVIGLGFAASRRRRSR